MPDMANIQKILTNMKHRFGHQSGLDEGSRRKSTVCLHGIAFHVYLMFLKISKKTNSHAYGLQPTFRKKNTCDCPEEKNACGKPETP